VLYISAMTGGSALFTHLLSGRWQVAARTATDCRQRLGACLTVLLSECHGCNTCDALELADVMRLIGVGVKALSGQRLVKAQDFQKIMSREAGFLRKESL